MVTSEASYLIKEDGEAALMAASEIKNVLNKFRAISSVDLAVVMDSDGMQLESYSRAHSSTDVESLCIAASTGLQVSEALGGATARGETRQAVLEYDSGVIVLEPLSHELTMLVVSTDPASIGKIRYLSKRYRQDLLQALDIG